MSTARDWNPEAAAAAIRQAEEMRGHLGAAAAATSVN
jgi:hypothetical protein